MPTVALLASPAKLLGFLLVAGDDSLHEGPHERDCIFSGFPSEAALLDHELGAFVQAHKHVEFQCHIQQLGSTTVLTLDVAHASAYFHLPTSGVGHWHVLHGSRQSIQGVCELAAG